MSTCPIYLDECNALRVNDSIYISKLDSAVNYLALKSKDLSDLNTKQGIKIKKLRFNVVKSGVLGLVVGFVLCIFAL